MVNPASAVEEDREAALPDARQIGLAIAVEVGDDDGLWDRVGLAKQAVEAKVAPPVATMAAKPASVH